MDSALSRKLAKFLISPKGLELSLEDRKKIIVAAAKAETETDLPKDIRDYISIKKERL